MNDRIKSTMIMFHVILLYTTVDTALEHILQLGRGTELAKVDIEHAFHKSQIPDHITF